jgi:hypothetical protein
LLPVPKLLNDFILNESEYQACKAWLAEANEETIRHPLGNPELEMQRQRIKSLIAEYEQNWRHSGGAVIEGKPFEAVIPTRIHRHGTPFHCGAGSSQAFGQSGTQSCGGLDFFSNPATRQVGAQPGRDSFPENEKSKEQQPN